MCGKRKPGSANKKKYVGLSNNYKAKGDKFDKEVNNHKMQLVSLNSANKASYDLSESDTSDGYDYGNDYNRNNYALDSQLLTKIRKGNK